MIWRLRRRGRLGIAGKLNALAVSMILLTAITIGVAVVRVQSRQAYQALQIYGTGMVRMLAQSAELPLYANDGNMLLQLVQSLGGNNDVAYVAFFDSERALLAAHDFRKGAAPVPEVSSWPTGEVTTTQLEAEHLISFMAEVRSHERQQSTALFIGPSSGTRLGYVRLVMASERTRKEALAFVNETARFAIVVAMLAIMLNLMFTRRLVRPVRELATAAREVAAGRLQQTIQVHSNDELADLGRAFQNMIESLTVSRARLLEYQNMLEERVQARTQELQAATAQALDLAQRDTLTDLPNRAYFSEELGRAIATHLSTGERMAVLFLDLDLFKRINDTLGHQAGDLLLVRIAEILKHCVREGDMVARLGGDEFVLLAREVKSTEQVTRLARRVLNAFAAPMEIEDHSFRIGFSIGISLCPDHGTDARTLLKNADLAMYATKEQGRGSYRFYTPELNQRAMERLNIESGLRRALDSPDELFLEFQPQVELNTGRLVAAEALLRWQPQGGAIIGPARFIPVAEETGLIVPIGERVLRQACATLAQWKAQGLRLPRIAVNIAAPQFESRDFCETVAQALADYDIPPDRLELELTESVIVRDADAALREMQRLKELGVSIALDDFGTGYSSLSYLSRLPIDLVKIDRAFVMRSTEDRNAHTIVRSIIALSHSLGYRVVAEGVETRAQVSLLRAAGCDYLQGYLLGRPMGEAAMAAWVASPLTPAEAALRGPEDFI
ncbi:EAL domain-containing protein [Niveibacterium sp. SC-1]|uniref:putative bifunctional diguanylate cyclase/phosphodiesterase n=1 Tax=Niveibacterium sp. SC-1 TaxID=3135646 RepID=UPI00311DDCBA